MYVLVRTSLIGCWRGVELSKVRWPVLGSARRYPLLVSKHLLKSKSKLSYRDHVESLIKTGHTGDKRNFTHIRDLVEAYWIAIEKCNPGELYLIGSDETEKIYPDREIIDKLISLADIGEISVKQVPEYTRPTSVPRLIGDTSKFRNLTGWKPKISVDKILEDTLEYWRDFVKNNHY